MIYLQAATSPAVLFSISLLLVLYFTFLSPNPVFNLRKVLTGYFSAINQLPGNLLWSVLLPLLLACASLQVKLIDTETINIIVFVVSIFLAMLFSIFGILINLSFEEQRYPKEIRKVFDIVIYESILSIFTLVLLLVLMFSAADISPLVNSIVNLFIYFFVFTLIFNLFIVIKMMKDLIFAK